MAYEDSTNTKPAPFYSLCWSTPAFSFGSGDKFTLIKKDKTIGDLNCEMLGLRGKIKLLV